MEEKIIDIDYADAVIMLQDMKKHKCYWGDNLLKLYRGHKNYLKQFIKTGSFDLEWYTEIQIKRMLCVLMYGNKAHFKILQPKTSTIKFDCLSGNYPKPSIWNIELRRFWVHCKWAAIRLLFK